MEEKGSSSPPAATRLRAGGTRMTIEGKVVVLGDMSVGKTSVVSRFTKDEFNPRTQSSVGVAYSQKKVTLDTISCKFCIWDTLGQEKFRSINTLYYRNAAAAIIVYDITSKASFDAIPYWVEQVRRFAVKNCIVCIAGNKCDAEQKREVPREEAQEYAQKHDMIFMEISAKTGDNVGTLFEEIAREARNHVVDDEEGFRILEVERGKLLDPSGDEKPATRSCCGGGGGGT